MPELVDKHFDKVSNNLFSDKVRDRLEAYCDRLENAYNKGDFENMIQITDNLLEYLSQKTTIYRDVDLFKRLRIDVTKSQMVRNNMGKGKKEKLSDIEEELLSKFDDEQMNIIKSDINVNRKLNESDVSMASFEMGTNIFNKIFDDTIKSY